MSWLLTGRKQQWTWLEPQQTVKIRRITLTLVLDLGLHNDDDDDGEVMLNVLGCRLTYYGQADSCIFISPLVVK